MDYINDKRIIKFKDDMNDTYDKNAVLHLVSGISLEELKSLKEVYKERKERSGNATSYKEAHEDQIREGVIDHLIALINYR